MEQRLKEDILGEASRFDNNILIHDEIHDEVVPCWEAVTPGTC